MVHINNNLVGRKISDDLRVNQRIEQPPMDTSDKVVLTWQVNDKLFPKTFLASGQFSNGTSTTLHTCHATKATYITSCWISWGTGATDTGITCAMAGTTAAGIGTTTLLQLEKQPSIADNQTANTVFPYPLKMSKSSSILLAATGGEDNEVSAGFCGFEIDDSNAGG